MCDIVHSSYLGKVIPPFFMDFSEYKFVTLQPIARHRLILLSNTLPELWQPDTNHFHIGAVIIAGPSGYYYH